MKRDELAEGGWYCQPRHISGTTGTNQSSSTTEEEEGEEPWSVLRAAAAGLQSPRFAGGALGWPAACLGLHGWTPPQHHHSATATAASQFACHLAGVSEGVQLACGGWTWEAR